MPGPYLWYEAFTLYVSQLFDALDEKARRPYVQGLMKNIPAGELLKVIQELHSGISCEATVGKTLEI